MGRCRMRSFKHFSLEGSAKVMVAESVFPVETKDKVLSRLSNKTWGVVRYVRNLIGADGGMRRVCCNVDRMDNHTCPYQKN